jgi:hypothetical protein
MAGEYRLSYRVVVVSEDPTNNGYILSPVVAAILSACGKPRARVSVLANPRTQGYEHAKALLKDELIERYRHVDLLLFLPDADGKDRAREFAALEEQARVNGTRLICCAAREELEAWLLAGHLDKLDIPWSQVRGDSSVKETVFGPFLERFGDARQPGNGRETLMRSTLKNYDGLKARCPEIAELEVRIKATITLQEGSES